MRWMLAQPSSGDRQALDGTAAILLSAMVVGLMDEIREQVFRDHKIDLIPEVQILQ